VIEIESHFIFEDFMFRFILIIRLRKALKNYTNTVKHDASQTYPKENEHIVSIVNEIIDCLERGDSMGAKYAMLSFNHTTSTSSVVRLREFKDLARLVGKAGRFA
jgi:hypothetical protein